MKKWKIPYLNALPVLVIALILCKLIFSANISVQSILETLYSCTAYFLFGLGFAYVLNPFVVYIENRLPKMKTEHSKKVMRASVIAFVYLTVLGFLTAFIMSIGPAIAQGVNDFMQDLPMYIESTKLWATDILQGINPDIANNFEQHLSEFAANAYPYLEEQIDMAQVGQRVSVTVTDSARNVVRVVFGMVISIYFLYGKEMLVNEAKRLAYAVFKTETADSIIAHGVKINKVFRDFIVSKFIQAFVIFVLGLCILIPFDVPLATLISLLLAITNMIPYIGPWIGAVPSVLLAFLFDPVKGLIVLLFVIGMQIVDNLFIGPKVMSDTVGISPLLVIAGVAIGGTFGGFFGMFIGVPLIAVVKLVFYDSFVERKLKEKQIDM